MFEELDRVVHQPIRTRIIAYLLTMEGAFFSDIKKTLHITDGHMTTHMRELIDNQYVIAEKKLVLGSPHTYYTVTPIGKQAFKVYINQLKNIIAKSSDL